MKRLAIITTHPIQYNAPLFRVLSERKRIAVKIFYTWGQSQEAVFDARFGLQRSWDIPLLDGYEYEFVHNVSKRPDSNRFWGVINPGLIKQLEQEQFDAILVYRWSLFSHLRILRSFGGKPRLFFRGDSHLLKRERGLKAVLKKQLLRFVYQRVDKAFYVGAYNKTYYRHSGLTQDQLLYAPHAIDNERFSADAEGWEAKASAERLLLTIPQHCLVFLYAGKFYEVKQLELLIEVFQQLKGDQYRLLLVGNGEQEEQLRASAATDDRILFQPFRNQSEMPLVYRLGDVFVLPSKRETWGLGVNEAMACSRPAIVSDACGCAPELIVERETGFVFRSGDEADLLTQMQQFTDKTVSKKMGEKAFEHIQQFSLERVAEVIEEAVGEVEDRR
ncbi:glycosyltransferase family 4 protein [Lacibacter sp.]|uniref:glycosyltransferase family 4 protein n=1 Tax=Lacibacter sp. TaxID=1915409 RepID=UPI002B4ADE23|nr:glycosyltransferase family 4 protein [Lacibacter sp.]HLP36081.1 glycosyltransferase family 4 protein [Lacibacter sp.]